MNAYAGSYASAVASSGCTWVNSCCCVGWTIPPNSTWPLRIDWSGFEASIPGYQLTSIISADITDMSGNPLPADPPPCIAIVSGLTPDPTPIQPGWTQIINKGGMAVTELLVETEDCPVGACYKLNLCAAFTDCAGRQAKQCVCVNITVTNC